MWIKITIDDVSLPLIGRSDTLLFYMLKQKLKFKIKTNEKTELVVTWLDGKLFAYKTGLIKNQSIFLANNIKLLFVWMKNEFTGVVNNSLTYSRNYFVIKCVQCVKMFTIVIFFVTKCVQCLQLYLFCYGMRQCLQS